MDQDEKFGQMLRYIQPHDIKSPKRFLDRGIQASYPKVKRLGDSPKTQRQPLFHAFLY